MSSIGADEEFFWPELLNSADSALLSGNDSFPWPDAAQVTDCFQGFEDLLSCSSQSDTSADSSPPFVLPDMDDPRRSQNSSPADDSSSDSGVSSHESYHVSAHQGRAGPQKRSRGAAAFLETLTAEEKAAFVTEGVKLPDPNLTLTKAEERVLKQTRRKIRNKIFAHDSRLKKKEYMSGLESRVESCTAINIELQQKVQTLEETNRTLLQQLQQLQAYVWRTNMGKAGTGTTLMLLALCCALFFPSQHALAPMAVNTFTPSGFQSRTLQGAVSGNHQYMVAQPAVATSTVTRRWLPFDWPIPLLPGNDSEYSFYYRAEGVPM